MTKDWRSGTLLGAGYGLVANGKVWATASSKDLLRAMWRRSAEREGQISDLPDSFIKQVCFVLPPWEPSDPEAGNG